MGRAISRAACACHEDLRSHTSPIASATGSSSMRTGRRSADSRRRSPMRCAASASRPTRRTSTRAISWSWSTPRRSRSPATSSADKRYYRHSGYPGGLKSRTLARDARAPARGGHPPRRQGDAAAQPAGAQADHEAEGLRRARPSARRPAASTDGEISSDRTPSSPRTSGGAADEERLRRCDGRRAPPSQRHLRRAIRHAEDAPARAGGSQLRPVAAEEAPAG